MGQSSHRKSPVDIIDASNLKCQLEKSHYSRSVLAIRIAISLQQAIQYTMNSEIGCYHFQTVYISGKKTLCSVRFISCYHQYGRSKKSNQETHPRCRGLIDSCYQVLILILITIQASRFQPLKLMACKSRTQTRIKGAVMPHRTIMGPRPNPKMCLYRMKMMLFSCVHQLTR